MVVNPNNWHWVDKNTFSWSQQYFEEKLPKLQVEDADRRVVVTRVSTVTGDSNVSQRKGKPICYFDLQIALEVAVLQGSDELASGSIDVPELTHDEKPEVRCNQGTFGEHHEIVETQFYPVLTAALLQYQPDLLEAHGGALGSSI